MRIVEEYVCELKLNKWLINRIGLHDKTHVGVPVGVQNARARLAAIHWIDDVEYELGHELGSEIEAQIKRFAANRWGQIAQTHVDQRQAEEELHRMLDVEFNHLYLSQNKP